MSKAKEFIRDKLMYHDIVTGAPKMRDWVDVSDAYKAIEIAELEVMIGIGELVGKQCKKEKNRLKVLIS